MPRPTITTDNARINDCVTILQDLTEEVDFQEAFESDPYTFTAAAISAILVDALDDTVLNTMQPQQAARLRIIAARIGIIGI